MPAPESAIRIVEVLPDLLATYGDSGNAVVLQERLRRRGIASERVRTGLSDPLPAEGDIYVLGGGEDTAQLLAVRALRGSSALADVVARNRVVFAVCAGLQILGRTFTGADGRTHSGLGLLDITTVPGRSRAVGEIVARPATELLTVPLTGFENHLGVTTLGPDARPLGRVVRGTGNGLDRLEGVLAGQIVGTYLHGPALARNPELADLLLGWAVGAPLPPLLLSSVDRLRRSRLLHRISPLDRIRRRPEAAA